MGQIRFVRDDLALFSAASHDRSRLHMSDEYARQTPYGEAIVFGILGAFASLGELGDRPGRELAKVSLIYRAPLYMEVDYRAEADDRSPDRAKVAMTDAAGSAMLSADFRFRDATGPGDPGEVAGTAPVSEQAEWRPEDLRPGIEATGRYAAEPGALRALTERWHLIAKGATMPQVTCLLWSSYLTGMHLPGLLGTSAQLSLKFRPDGPPPTVPFIYRSSVVDFDGRFDLLHTATTLSGEAGTFADAEVWSHIRSGT